MRTYTFADMTKPQQRQLVAGFARDSLPMRVRMKDGTEYDLRLVGTAQEERRSADPYSERGNLLLAQFDATGAWLVLSLADVAEVAPLRLLPTDPRSPEYVEEEKVVRPIPREALAARKVAGDNQHAQR